MIERQEIQKLASLSRIAVSEQELDTFRNDIDRILSYVSELSAVPVPERTDVAFFGTGNVLREDTSPNTRGAMTEALLARTPRHQEGRVVVKRVL